MYVGGRDANNRSRIFALDIDPADRCRVLASGESPVLDLGAPGAFDGDGVGPASVLRVGDEVWLYYTGVEAGSDVPYKLQIGLAISADGGRTFRRADVNPVLGTSASDPHFVSTPCVWAVKGGWRCLYMSCVGWDHYDGRWESLYHLKQADSADGLVWTVSDAPAIELQANEAGLARPTVQPLPDGRWQAWFSVRGRYQFRNPSGETYRLQTATSLDGMSWQRDTESFQWSPPPDPACDWDGWMQTNPCVLAYGGRWLLFYNGNDFGGRGVGWASRAGSGTSGIDG